MKFLLKMLQGGLIGLAAVIPGFSGGTIACIAGCYDDIIEAVSGIRKHFKQSILTLIPYVIGILISALLFIVPITWGIKNYPLITLSLFSGLLIGGLPSFYKNIKGKSNPKNILSAVLCGIVVLLIVIPSLFVSGNNINIDSTNPLYYFLLLLMGVIGSAALVIPGISGSMVLLMLGFYEPIMDTIKGFLVSVANGIGLNLTMDFATPGMSELVGPNYILPSFFLCFCFGIGIIIGFFLISKLMKYLLSKHATITYFGIFGFILASLVGIYADPTYFSLETYGNSQTNFTIQIILAFVAIIIGFLLSFFLSKIAENKEKKDNV